MERRAGRGGCGEAFSNLGWSRPRCCRPLVPWQRGPGAVPGGMEPQECGEAASCFCSSFTQIILDVFPPSHVASVSLVCSKPCFPRGDARRCAHRSVPGGSSLSAAWSSLEGNKDVKETCCDSSQAELLGGACSWAGWYVQLGDSKALGRNWDTASPHLLF